MDYKGISKLDEAISKYGGGDAQYELELKKKIREGMGYSNYLSKQNALMGSDVDLPDVEGMTPAGIKSMVSGAIGIQEGEMNSLDKILGGVDSAAGSLASSLAAKARASAASKKDNPFEDVKPENWVQSEVLAYAKNPYNQDGTLKTRDQLRKELEGQFIGEGGVNDIQGVTESTIQETINSMLPEDFEQNPKSYQFQAMGFSKTQANTLSTFDEYANGKMTETKKLLMEVQHPDWEAKAEKYKTETPDLAEKLNMTKNEETGQEVPAYGSLTQLINDYPNADPEELKETIKPIEANDIKDTVSQYYEKDKETIDKILEKDPKNDGGFNGLLAKKTYKDFKEKLTVAMRQRGVFTEAEIRTMIDDYMYNNVKSKL